MTPKVNTTNATDTWNKINHNSHKEWENDVGQGDDSIRHVKLSLADFEFLHEAVPVKPEGY